MKSKKRICAILLAATAFGVAQAQEEPVEPVEPSEFPPLYEDLEREEIERNIPIPERIEEEDTGSENAEAMELELDLSPDPALMSFAALLEEGKAEIVLEGTKTQSEAMLLAAEYGIAMSQMPEALQILGTRALLFQKSTGRVLAAIRLPDGVRRNKEKVNPEIRMFGRENGQIAIEYRGWHTDKYEFEKCTIIFEYQVNVVDRNLASKKTFGRIQRPYEYIKVLSQPVDGTNGLYVLVIPTVEVNKKKIGQPFTETHLAITQSRKGANPAKTIDMPKVERWLVVEHELVHAEQIYRAYTQTVRKLVSDNKLCNPTKPIARHRAILQKTFTANWIKMTASGHGGSHEQGTYPNTPAETEAREVMWRLWDARNP
ncbi:hypothetical protein [Parvularcula marina]|uniref:DUF922 domain-containing protein n=1 Tax=Parvularcula marina TaxID=2292771 RepID=A0A371RKI4_9PROT|nr:hypothetical protein [Parvularcula marina]RFB05958.1 hypothetical protein DX908_12205 [Parvularcula marina]